MRSKYDIHIIDTIHMWKALASCHWGEVLAIKWDYPCDFFLCMYQADKENCHVYVHFYDFSNGFWTCSDRVSFLFLYYWGSRYKYMQK
jgi:hypothetical protein